MSKEITRVGKVSSVNYETGKIKVAYHEKDDSVTREIPLLSNEYQMPPIGSQVLVVHLANGTEAGVVLGRPWSDKNMPAEGGEGLYRKELGTTSGEAYIRYQGGTLLIHAENVVIEGNLSVNGNLSVSGTISGTVVAG